MFFTFPLRVLMSIAKKKQQLHLLLPTSDKNGKNSGKIPLLEKQQKWNKCNLWKSLLAHKQTLGTFFTHIVVIKRMFQLLPKGKEISLHAFLHLFFFVMAWIKLPWGSDMTSHMNAMNVVVAGCMLRLKLFGLFVFAQGLSEEFL